jgi:hypothetical protein
MHSIVGPALYGMSTHCGYVYSVLAGPVMLAGVTCILVSLLHDLLSDNYMCSQPAATSQRVHPEKPDKIIMDVYHD